MKVNPAEFKPEGISIEASSGEQKLINIFRGFSEVEKKNILAELTARGAAAKRERESTQRCIRNDADRAARREKSNEKR